MIGIVGGGLSGLFLLDILADRGVDALLLEAADTPGGVSLSRLVDGPDGPVTVDLGPQRVRLTPGLAALVERAGLTPSILQARSGVPFTVNHGGRLHPAPFSLGAALRTPLISPFGKLRALADFITPPPRPDESVANAFRRKLGPEIHTRLAGPILGGLYGSDPEDMDARHTLLPVLARTGGGRSLLRALLKASRGASHPVVSFREGMGALPMALARRHAERIRLGTPVISVEGAGTSGGTGSASPSSTGMGGRGGTGGSRGSGFRLVTAADEIQVDQVVLTLPAPAVAGMLDALVPEAAGRFGSLRYNPLVVVPLVVPEGVAVPEVGSGFKETLESSALTRGVTAHGALFDRRGLFSAFLGGMGREELLNRSDEVLMAVARDEFRAVTGVEPVPLLAHRTWMPAWDRSWKAMDGLALPAGVHICAAYAHRPGIPGRLEDARRVAELLLRPTADQSSIAPR